MQFKIRIAWKIKVKTAFENSKPFLKINIMREYMIE